MDQKPAPSETPTQPARTFGPEYVHAYSTARRNAVKAVGLANVHMAGTEAHRGFQDGTYDGFTARAKCLRGEAPWAEMENLGTVLSQKKSA